jgi:FtsH-binding integral membrane protein
MIVLFFWGLGNWDMIILSVFGVLLSGIYILIDLLKLMTPDVCSYDDYILGALMLYLDMVRMFIYILRIFAEAKK